MSTALTITTFDGETFDLRDRIAQVAQEVESIADLTPERVLGLSSSEVSRLREGSDRIVRRGDADRQELNNVIARCWHSTYLVFSSRSAYLVASTDGQQAMMNRIMSGLSAAAASAGRVVVLEELREGSDQPVAEINRASVVHLYSLSARALTASARRSSPRAARDPGAPRNPDRDDPRNVFLDGQLVATLGPGRNQARLWVHPFVARGSYTASQYEDRVDFASRVVAAVVDAIGVVYPESLEAESESPAAEVERQLREAVALLDMMPAFARAREEGGPARERILIQRIGRHRWDLTRLRDQLVEAFRGSALANERVAVVREVRPGSDMANRFEPDASAHDAAAQELRERVVESLRQRRAVERELEQLRRAQGALSRERVIDALMEVYHIRQLGPVRSVRVVSAPASALRVQLHPVVIQYRNRRFLLDRLEFDMPLNEDQINLRWTSVTDYGSPHPHVSSNGHTCWGNALDPLSDALSRREFSTAVMLICGWARLYNAASPYVNIGHFPQTDLAPGFHPELPMGL